MASSAPVERDPSLELVVCDVREPPVAGNDASGRGDTEESAPLLSQPGKPKINIFTISYPQRRPRPREQVIKSHDADWSPVIQFISLLWSGSRYSGLLCMVVSSTFYFIMDIISDAFSVQSIPLYEKVFARSTIILILSYAWLRKSGQSIFEPRHVRKFLVSRALLGYLSLMGFIFCIQRLPLSRAAIISFTTPIMASIAARMILLERLRIGEIGGLACSFSGVLFIFQRTLITQGGLTNAGKLENVYLQNSHYMYPVFVGIISAITGGVSYCCIRAASKDSNQPMSSLFSFSLLAAPAAATCTFLFEDFVLPGPYSLFLMVILGLLAFLAELFLAHALQLEKTSKVANVQYMQVALLELWRIGLRRDAPSFGHLIGSLLILVSTGYTIYVGPDKETV